MLLLLLLDEQVCVVGEELLDLAEAEDRRLLLAGYLARNRVALILHTGDQLGLTQVGRRFS